VSNLVISIVDRIDRTDTGWNMAVDMKTNVGPNRSSIVPPYFSSTSFRTR
jgi:hypothetical protein